MELKQNHQSQQETAAGKPNLTGIPPQKKLSFERSSGLSFDDVRVHYHSALPSRPGAPAYTQGSHVYVAPGQERHLGHELGHIIQQKQGRVRATSELNGIRLNTSPAMEREADTLCRQAEQGRTIQRRQGPPSEVVQMAWYPNAAAMWAGICTGAAVDTLIQQIIARDPVLAELYRDAVRQIPFCDFNGGQNNTQISIIVAPGPLRYHIDHRNFPDNPQDQYFFISSVIHELAHAAANTQYHHDLPEDELGGNEVWLNMNLPPADGTNRITPAQDSSLIAQERQLRNNIGYLRTVCQNDTYLLNQFPQIHAHLQHRLDYLDNTGAHIHYDTVLSDMMFYLQFNHLQDTSSYRLMQRMLREANDRRHQRRWFGNNRAPYAFSSWPGCLSRY